MICELAPAMTLYPSGASLEVYQEPYELSLFRNSDYYVKREIESLLHDRHNSFSLYPRSQNMMGVAHPSMIAAATRRLTDLYRREQAREIELQAKRRLWHVHNMLSDIDANLWERRRPYRDGTFVEYGHSLYEPTFVPLVEKQYVNDHIRGVKYFSPRSRVYGKEKKKMCAGKKRHQIRGQTKVGFEPKQLKSAEKVIEQDAESKPRSEHDREEVSLAEHQQKATTSFESSASEPKPSKSVEKLDQSIQQHDPIEEAKTTNMEATQKDMTKKKARSGHETKACSSIQKEAISNNTSCIISRCPSIEEVEDEEFKDWQSCKGNRL